MTSESWKKRTDRMGLKKLQVNKYVMIKTPEICKNTNLQN